LGIKKLNSIMLKKTQATWKLAVYVASGIAIALYSLYAVALTEFQLRDEASYEKYNIVSAEYDGFTNSLLLVVAILGFALLIGFILNSGGDMANITVSIAGYLTAVTATSWGTTTFTLSKFKTMEPEAYASFRKVVSEEKWTIVVATLLFQAVLWASILFTDGDFLGNSMGTLLWMLSKK
jgi:hypothetical protein